jgi:hypothetical protein
VDTTPDLGLLGTSTLADFMNHNERDILLGRFVVPLRFEGAPFQGGSAINVAEPWTAPGVRDLAVRRAFSVATCNGCHSIDPVDGELRTMNDLLRRKLDLEELVCRCSASRCEHALDDLHRLH